MRPVTVTVDSASISDPIPVNWRGAGSFKLGLGVKMSNPVDLSYTVEHSFDDPNDYSSGSDYNTNAKWFPTSGLTGETIDAESNIAFPVRAVRLSVVLYTTGSATLTVIQGS